MWRCTVPYVVILLGTPAIAWGQLNPQYNTANFHTYLLTPNNVSMSWQAARDYARTFGGYLVSINDPGEHAFVDGNYTGNTGTRRWIGLSDQASEGNFVWDSGEPVTYTAWAGGEPNNVGNEDYAEMIGAAVGLGLWNDNSSPPLGAGPTTAVIEMPHGDRVNFELQTASCASAFPTPLGAAGDPEGVSWNGAGGAGSPALVATAPSAGFPVQGSKYLRLNANGPINQPLGGPFNRPGGFPANEVRVRIPPGAKGVSFVWEFHVAESQNSPFNDGMSIDVINQSGLLLQDLVYADTSATPQTAGTLTLCTGVATTPTGGSGPQERSALLPPLPAVAYLSIVCWNGTDDALSSAAHVDAIHFWGYGNFKLAITSPFGPGSIRLQNTNGASGNVYWTPVTLSQGSFPHDWFYGIDVSANDLITQVLAGPPFSGNLGAGGTSTFTLPSGVAPGLNLYAVSLRFANGVAPFGQGFIEASAPEHFITQ
jgi:Lectin C-type domain